MAIEVEEVALENKINREEKNEEEEEEEEREEEKEVEAEQTVKMMTEEDYGDMHGEEGGSPAPTQAHPGFSCGGAYIHQASEAWPSQT